MGRWKGKGGRKIEEWWNGKWERGWRSVNIKKINIKNNYRKIGKEKKNFFFSFKLKRLTQNPKVELKRLYVGLDSGTK